MTNNPEVKRNRELTNCKCPREMSPGTKKDVPNSSLLQPLIPNIIKQGQPTKSQSGLESEVTSPHVVKKPLPTKIDEESKNVDGFTCAKCDKWFRREHHHYKHVQFQNLWSVENGEFTKRNSVCNFRNEGGNDTTCRVCRPGSLLCQKD